MKTKNLLVLLIVMALFGGTPSAWAVWTGASIDTTYAPNGTRDYDYTGNWFSSAIDDSFSGFLLTGDLTVTLDANRTAIAGMNFDHAGASNLTIANNNTTAKAFTLNGGISFQPSSATRTLTIGSSANQIGFNLNNSTRTFTVGAGQTMAVNGAITSTTAGSGLLTKDGSGTLSLNVASTYTGLTTVNGGELRWGIANALSSGNLTINNGGTVNMQTFTDTVGAVTIAKGGTISGTTGTLTPAGIALVSNNGGTITLGASSTGFVAASTVTYNDTIDGSTTLNIQRLSIGSLTLNVARGDDASGVDVNIDILWNSANAGRTIVKNGSGVAQLSGSIQSENFGLGDGPTTINDGTLIFNKSAEVTATGFGLITIGDGIGSANSAVLQFRTSNNQIGSNAITINSDGLFDLNGKSETTSGALNLNSTGQLQLNNGSLTVGSFNLNPSTGNTTSLSLGASDTLTLGGDVTFNAAGTGRAQITGSALALAGANRTFTVGLGTGADYDLLIGAGISGASSLTKAGTGRLILTGSNNYTLGTVVNVGTLQIGDGTTAGTMTSTGALTLGGGTFAVRGPASGGSSQTVASLATTAGTVSTIRLIPGASDNTTLTITGTTLSTGAGSSVNFDYTAGTTVGGTVGNNYVVWNPTLTAGIIGGAYTVTDSGGTGFATTSGGNVVRLTDSGGAGLPVSGGSATGSYFIGSDYSTDSTTTPGSLVEALSGAVAASNVKVDTTGLTSGANLALGENLLTLGAGMVISGSNPYEISGSGAGGLKAASAGGTIYLNNASSGIVTISAPIVNNTASRLTVDGPGTTILSGVNTYTGATIVNGGIVRFSGTMAASPITINNGATQLGTATGLTSANTVTFGAGSIGRLQLLGNSLTIGALNSNATLGTPVIANNNGGGAVANATLTINSGSSSSFGGVIQDGTGGGTLALIKSGAGTLTLSGSNTYSGGTVINAGTVSFTADANLGDASGGITFNGGSLVIGANLSINSTRNITVTGTGSSMRVGKNWTFSTSGALTGSGSITFVDPGGSGGTPIFNFSSSGNTFTGSMTMPVMDVRVSSLGDVAGNNIVFTAAGTFRLNSSGVTTGLTFNNRAIELSNASATIENLNTSYPITIGSNLVATGAGAKTLTLTAAAGPVNTFAGAIGNGSGGGTIAVTKAGAGIWILSGTNTHSGVTGFGGSQNSGTLILQGAASASPNSSFSLSEGSTLALRDDTAGTVTFGAPMQVNLTSMQTSARATSTINVDRISIGSNSTLEVGKLNYAGITDNRCAGATVNIAGGNGYSLQFSSIDLDWGINGSQNLNPTTASVIINGTVRHIDGRPVTGTMVQNVAVSTAGMGVVLDGTAIGNIVSGNIMDAADYDNSSNANALPLTLTKTGTGTWTLSGTNSYAGGTTITAGKLLFNGADSLPTTGTVAVGASGHLSLADGGARNQTVSALTLTSLASLSFDWTGSGTGDQLTSTADITPTAASGFYINLNRSGTPGGSVTLLTGGASSTLSSSTCYLANATDYTATLTTTPTTLSVGSFTSQTPLTTFYWVGDKLSATIAGVRNAWALSDGTKGNWSSTTTAYTATPLTPGATANVIFAKNQAGITQHSTVLGSDVTINSLVIDDSTAVTIAGANGAALTLMSSLSTAGLVDGTPGSAITVTANANATSTISSRVNLGANQTWHVASGKTLTVSGIVGGDFGLTKASAGTLTLSALPEYTGATTISAGALTFGGGATGGASIIGRTSGITLSQGATLNFNPATTGINNVYTAGAPITLSGGAGNAYIRVAGNDVRLYVSGNVTGQSGVAQTLSISQGLQPNGATSNGDREAIRFSGVIANGGSGGTLGVSVVFAGSSGVAQNAFVNLSGQNTFTGDLAVTNSIGINGPVAYSHPGAWLTIGGERYSPNATIIGNLGNGYLGGGNYAGNISISAGTGLTTLSYFSTANQTLSGTISGTGALQMDGTGTLTLSGNNTYTGTTTVSGGTLVLSGEKSIADTGTLNIAGGKVEVATKEKVTVLQYSGTTQPIGTYGSTSSTANNKNNTYFSGTGVLYVGVEFPPAGTLILFM